MTYFDTLIELICLSLFASRHGYIIGPENDPDPDLRFHIFQIRISALGHFSWFLLLQQFLDACRMSVFGWVRMIGG
jgi:hypothetical protein